MKVTSADGTPIAYDQHGRGPAVVLVDGALCYRGFGPMPELAVQLAERFTVYHYDRRGRGDSGDTPPYAVNRELEDLAAIAAVAGEPVRLFGISSGAALAIRAVAHGVAVAKLAIFEPPLVTAGAPAPTPPDRMAEIEGYVRAGKRSAAVKTFMRMVGVPGFVIPIMRVMPGVWRKLTAVSVTLPNDFAVVGHSAADKPMPPELAAALAQIALPTLVGLGGKSPAYMRHACELVAQSIAGSTLEVLPGQRHNVSARAIAPVLTAFFSA